MLTAQELRIGNKVLNTLGSGQEIMLSVTSNTIEKIDNGDESYYPIPLTPEILEKCGFVKDGFNAHNLILDSWEHGETKYSKLLCFHGDYLYIKEIVESVSKRRQEDIVTLSNKDIVKEFYLHRLQNLYLDLTGTELQITL